MSSSEDSFVLLSSMSPRIDKNAKKKVAIKKGSKLTLKTHIRRSSVYKATGFTRNNSNVCTVSSASSDEVSSNNDVIVIDSTSDSVSIKSEDSSQTGSDNICDSLNDEAKHERLFDLINKYTDECPKINGNVVPSVNKWLDDLPTNVKTTNRDVNNKKKGKVKEERFSDLINKCTDESPKTNGTVVPSVNKWLDDLPTNVKTTNRDVNNKKEDKVKEERFSDLINKYTDESPKTNGNVIPSVNKWRDDLPINVKTTNRDVDNKKEDKVKEERLSDLINKYIDESPKTNGNVVPSVNKWLDDLPTNVKTTNRDKKEDKVKDVHEKKSLENCSNDFEEITNSFSDDSCGNSDKGSSPSTPVFTSYQKKLLDELYGDGWKSSVKKPKARKKSLSPPPLPSLNVKSHTDVKKGPKKSLTYKNPYLDSERKKSENILRTLEKERIQKKIESPRFKRAQKLFDSDSDSDKENYKLNRQKLPNDDSSSDDESPVTATPIKHRQIRIKPSESKRASFLESLSMTVPIDRCDPSARIYRENFKAHRDALTKKLLAMYNENVFDGKLPDNIIIEWSDRMVKTAGYCYCRKITHRSGLVIRNSRIVLSSKVVDSADRLRDTFIHELCHAASWIVHAVANGHGAIWKAWTVKAMKFYPELPPIKRCHSYAIQTKYTYKCTQCGYSFGRHSKSLDMERKRCGICYGQFELLINKTTKSGVKSVTATPGKGNAFSDYVKNNYKNVKTDSMSHGDVMKALGKQYKEMKITN